MKSDPRRIFGRVLTSSGVSSPNLSLKCNSAVQAQTDSSTGWITHFESREPPMFFGTEEMGLTSRSWDHPRHLRMRSGVKRRRGSLHVLPQASVGLGPNQDRTERLRTMS